MSYNDSGFNKFVSRKKTELRSQTENQSSVNLPRLGREQVADGTYSSQKLSMDWDKGEIFTQLANQRIVDFGALDGIIDIQGFRLKDKGGNLRFEVSTDKMFLGLTGNSTSVSTDTTTGDYTDIQSAVDYLNGLGGGIVYIDSGTYSVTSDLTLYNNIVLQGNTPQDTIISFGYTNSSVLIKGTLVYDTGTISATSGSATITGSGTNWLSNVAAGQSILLGSSNWFTISSVDSDTQLTISLPYFGNNLSGNTYTIATVKDNIGLKNLTVLGSASNGIDCQYTNNVRIENLFSLANLGDGIVTNTSTWNVWDYVVVAYNIDDGFVMNETYNSSYSRFFDFENTGNGMTIDTETNNSYYYIKSYSNAQGINLTNSTDTTWTGVDCKYNSAEGMTTDGCSSTVITNSIFSDNGSSGESGLDLNNNTDKLSITNSLFEDNDDYGINVAAGCDNNVIVSNIFDGNATGGVSDSGTDTIIRSNAGQADN